MSEELLQKYLGSYSVPLLKQVTDLVQRGKLGAYLQHKYPTNHEIRSDKALYEMAVELKNRFMKNSPPLDKVLFDSRIQILNEMLGVHTISFHQHGQRVKARREIRIASLFKNTPAAFLEMILVHELAHQKERNHDKAFYQLCCRMLPDYLQLEFDLRLYLIQAELNQNV